ncbi:restriction endonuclease subunit S [Aeromonas sp. 604534]|uniref:restriction endonuclease subunit S n=2 Tax=Aeromonas TaxID=642 RepID=UPI003BA1F280
MIAAELKTTGQYQPYPEYKDSGAAWLGNTPSHWTVFHGKRLLKQRRETARPKSTQLAASQAFGVIPQSLLMEMTGNKVMLALKGTDNFKHVSENDFVISLRSFEGGIEHSSYSGCVSPAYTVLQAVKAIHPWFYRYLFKSSPYIAALQASTDSLRDGKSITFEQFGAISLPLPSPEEQRIIATFLDYETARIDRLIAQQQRLIELLKEKRQAVISHAVTKGLNPDATMKDSGIEWLGQVPEHWIVKPLRHLGYCQNGINIGAEAFGSGYPFVSYGDAYKNRVLPETGSGLVQSTPEDRKRYSLLAGDVLFTRTSETIEEIGFASTCLKTIENACFAGFLIRFRPNPNDLDANYSKYYFSNQLLRAFFIKEMNLITRASLSQDLLKAMPVVLPPRTEQKAIAEVLDEKSKRFDRLQQLGDEQIKILQERRTALISAAVTGKIDLRGWTPPADEVAA